MVLNTLNIRNARPFLAAIMATLIAVLATATVSGGWASAQDGGTAPGGTDATPAAGTDDTPQGQLTRRGIAGKATRIDESSFVMETRFGNVHVLVTDETTFRKPPEGLVRFDALEVGDRVGVLLVKAENDTAAESSGSLASSEDVIRTATALKVLIVPDRATRRHVRAVVLERMSDRVRVIDRNGDEQEIKTDVAVGGEAGDELLLVTQESEDGVGLRLRAAVHARIIEERLDRIEQKREDLKERLENVRERVAERRAETIDRVKTRLDEVDVDDRIKTRVREAAEEIKSRLNARIEEVKERRAERQEDRREKREEVRDGNSLQSQDQNSGRGDGAAAEESTPGPADQPDDSNSIGDERQPEDKESDGSESDATSVDIDVRVDGSVNVGR